MKKSVFLVIFFFIVTYCSVAQIISLNNPSILDYLRREQLLDSGFNNSFCILPVTNLKQNNAVKRLTDSFFCANTYNQTKDLQIKLLPLGWIQQYNSKLPYGRNDGLLIPAVGNQVSFSGGIYASKSKFTLQLSPEIVFAENLNFYGFPKDYNDQIWANYYQLKNRIDLPDRFGTKSITKFYPGQSSLRYNFNSLSAGVSTENIRWGPGITNSLIFSGNAPGFLHFTFNTTNPIQTSIGSFEGQLIAGYLSSSNNLPTDTSRSFNGVKLFSPKFNEIRYVTGLTISWQPKWVKGLFLGFAKASYEYKSDVSGIIDILPLNGFLGNKVSQSEKLGHKASLGSIFMRWKIPEEKTEFYVEYGLADKAATPFNIFRTEPIPKGYVAGVNRLFPLNGKGQYIHFLIEITQMWLTSDSLRNQFKSWYLDSYVREGFTNQGKILGAGIGPGSNSQLIEISWVKDFKKAGVSFERVLVNSDFFYYTFKDIRSHWVDLAYKANFDWNFKKMLLKSEFGFIKSLNYQWFFLPNPNGVFFDPGTTKDIVNFHGKVSLSYFF